MSERFVLTPLVLDDLSEIRAVMHASFSQSYYKRMYPQSQKEDEQWLVQQKKRLVEEAVIWKKYKMVDTENKKIVAYTSWKLPQSEKGEHKASPASEDGDTVQKNGTLDNERARIGKLTAEIRAKHLPKKPYLCELLSLCRSA